MPDLSRRNGRRVHGNRMRDGLCWCEYLPSFQFMVELVYSGIF